MPASDAGAAATAPPFIVAVTGGVGSGKSTVARIFEGLGATVIDADRIAAEVIELPEIRAQVEAAFGAVYDPSGGLDRAALADRIFTDATARERLNDIVHPEVRARIDKALAALGATGSDNPRPPPGKRPLVLLDIPLLETSPYPDRADVVLFIDAPREDRLRRVRATRGWSSEELTRREASQVSLTEKERRADLSLINRDGDDPTAERERLEARCRALYEEWTSGGAE